MRLKTMIKVVFSFHNFVPPQGVWKIYISLLPLIFLTQIQFKIFNIHFYEAALLFMENDHSRRTISVYNFHCNDICHWPYLTGKYFS
jgi:hypothetical protein